MKKKRVIKPHVWTPEALEDLRACYGVMSCKAIASRLSAKFGRRFTANSVQSGAAYYGINRDNAQAYLTVAQAAEELGSRPSRLLRHCQNNGLKLLGHGPHTRYLSEESWERVQRDFAPLPEAAIGVAEAARRLFLTYATIQARVERGVWPSYLFGGRRFVPLALVEAEERANRGGRLLGDAPVVGARRKTA